MKYLFKADFTDGTSYEQNDADISVKGFGNGSCFSDINERVKEGALLKFSLIGEHLWSVDLTDGHFEVDGIPFQVNAEIIPKPLQNYRLIYFRRVSQKTTEDIVVDEHMQPVVKSMSTARGEIIGFRFGWQANDANGKNYQQILEIH